MDNMTRLYREDYPDGLLFLPNEVNIAKAQGWTNTIDIIAKPVPEPENKVNLCACGCGTPTQRTWAPGHYAKHQKAMKEKQGGYR